MQFIYICMRKGEEDKEREHLLHRSTEQEQNHWSRNSIKAGVRSPSRVLNPDILMRDTDASTASQKSTPRCVTSCFKEMKFSVMVSVLLTSPKPHLL